MLSSVDLERLIAEKRREIEMEKSALGLSLPVADGIHVEDLENHENPHTKTIRKTVPAELTKSTGHDRELEKRKEEENNKTGTQEIPADLERYIRRYLGLPVMLKAGEFSPNNPILRGERHSGDVLLGLGEYERRRNTLRKMRQQQYREYLDQQAKKKQEERQNAEKLRREQEDKERRREEERERFRQELERDRASPEPRRASVCHIAHVDKAPTITKSVVDTGIQASVTKPLSVAVQTDDDLYGLPSAAKLTAAERELSPRNVTDRRSEWDHRDHTDRPLNGDGQFDVHNSSPPTRSNRSKLMNDLRHTYMPSILDAEAIRIRNLQAEKEAAERRQFYQQELKHQIEEQQRIRDERKAREKMLEQAEMRRLEQQLRMLRMAQDKEVGRQRDISDRMKNSATEYEQKRQVLQREIEYEEQNLRAKTHPATKRLSTDNSENRVSNLPFYYPKDDARKSFSTNIPETSIFSPTYDVDSYLRKNLNPSKEALFSNRLDTSESNYPYDLESIGKIGDSIDQMTDGLQSDRKLIVEKALIHERPKEKAEKPQYEPSCLRKDEIRDETPIPVLRHSPMVQNVEINEELSEKMRLVDDKWKVPAVQKNILKTVSDEGKPVSILTQLGSIRRQLQLEQMRLDNLKGTGK